MLQKCCKVDSEMNSRQKFSAIIRRAWADRLTLRPGTAPNELYASLHPDHLSSLPEICEMITRSFLARFVTLIPVDERASRGSLSVFYVFSIAREDLFLILQVPVDPRHMELPSITAHVEAANYFEREMNDWFGVMAFPNVHRLASHPDWPDDAHPMLKDFDLRKSVPRVKGSFDFGRVEGEGVFEIPVGPVHAGIIEPGHFRFSVAGEPIINLDIQLHFVHKGTEKLGEGRRPEHVVFLAERVSGDSAFAHAAAYCAAVERLAGIEIPQRAIVVRTILLEMERLYNHIGDIGAILLDVGYAVGAASAFHLKEELLQLNEIMTGSRLLHGMARIGGVSRYIDDTAEKHDAIRATLNRVERAFDTLIEWTLTTSSVLDRLQTTGILLEKDARQLGTVGVAARASGIDRDLRKDHPHLTYPYLEYQPVVHKEGDVFARFKVRVEEVAKSFEITRRLLGEHHGEPIVTPIESLPASSCALGYVEGWRGEIVHWVMTDPAGKISRWKITDPSFHNWRAVSLAVRGNIVPDFPVINKSFNLSYSGNDR
jgi:Ni,Fe-hydrogenase III large subunit/Ni,Fe-hydrogenase III component G